MALHLRALFHSGSDRNSCFYLRVHLWLWSQTMQQAQNLHPTGKAALCRAKEVEASKICPRLVGPSGGLRSAADGSICCDMYVPEEASRDRREVRHAVAERLKLPLQAGPRKPQLSLLPFGGAGKAAMSRWSSGCAARVQMSRMEWSVSPCCRVGRLECLGAGPFAVATCSLQSALVPPLSA